MVEGAVLAKLRSARLVLRPHVPGDYESSYAPWSDPATTSFIGGRPFTREECWARLLRYIGLSPALAYGYWRCSSATLDALLERSA